MKKLIGIMGVLALFAGNAIAQEGGEKECTHKEKAHFKHGKGKAMLEDIPNVTDEQKASFKAMREEGKKKTQPEREKLRAIKEKLHGLKTSENPDMNAMNQLIDDMHKLQAELDKEKVAAHIKMRSILTPEQRKALDAKQAERKAKHEEMRKERKEMKEAK